MKENRTELSVFCGDLCSFTVGFGFLLQILDASLQWNSIFSILYTYFINGIDLPFNTINTIHHEFKRMMNQMT
jgi:hypothetical protein